MTDRFLDADRMVANGVPVQDERTAPVIDVAPIRATGLMRNFADLTDLSSEYAVFSISPVLQALGIQVDPVQVYVQNENVADADRPVLLDMPWDIATGFARQFPLYGRKVDLNRRLYACPKRNWEACRQSVAAASCTSLEHQYYARLCTHETLLVDVFRMYRVLGRPHGTIVETHTLKALLPSTSFAVAANIGTFVLAFEGDAEREAVLPEFRRAPPQATIVFEAQQLFNSTRK